MDLKSYFENAKGRGILATADSAGHVDAAIYSIPHVFDDGTVGFVMRERLTHQNLNENPFAAYIFMESHDREGLRLFLRKTGETTDSPLIAEMTRGSLTPEQDKAKGPKYLVTFAVERVLQLVGGAEKK